MVLLKSLDVSRGSGDVAQACPRASFTKLLLTSRYEIFALRDPWIDCF